MTTRTRLPRCYICASTTSGVYQKKIDYCADPNDDDYLKLWKYNWCSNCKSMYHISDPPCKCESLISIKCSGKDCGVDLNIYYCTPCNVNRYEVHRDLLCNNCQI